MFGEKWKTFEMLKGTLEPDAGMIEEMNAEEVKEGVIEFMIQREREERNVRVQKEKIS